MNKNPFSRIISFKSGFGSKINKRKLTYWGLFVVAIISMTLILAWKYFPDRNYKEGVVAAKDILSPRTFEVEDKEATREAQVSVMNEVKPVYKIDPFVLSHVDRQLKKEFELFAKLRKAKEAKDSLQMKDLKSRLPVSISDTALSTFVSASPRELDQLEISARDLVTRHMKEKIRKKDIPELKKVRQKVRKAGSELTFRKEQNDAVVELASEAIRPNAVEDWNETSRLKQQKKDSVQPVMISIKKGQLIVRKGDIITPEHIRILEKMGIHRSRFDFTGFGGTALLVIISISLGWIYIRRSRPDLAENPKHMLLIFIITLGNMLICSLLIQVNPYWAPIPIASILTAILVGPRVAVVITAYLAMVVGILTGEVQYLIVSLITGFAASLLSWRVRDRLDLITASLLVFVVNEVSIFVFSLLTGETTRVLLENLVFGGINGFSSGVVAIGMLPLLEYAFDITTDIKLLELSNQSEPLMKRLLLEAPGTYHHSIIVGNLAEAGGEVVNEDPLLCRVAAYYHDIGKLRRPYFFIENQLGAENPHDNLTPRLSSLIITSHVKDGIDLAKQYKLPTPIREIISQHHGASLVAYFYHQARQNAEEEPQESDFRYSGPKPQNKAAAIVMLADAVEAAARTIQNPTPKKIESLVRSIFKKILDDGQLDESPLSLKDINNLINSFTNILTGIYHHRIEYPDQLMENGSIPSTFPSSKVAHINAKTKKTG